MKLRSELSDRQIHHSPHDISFVFDEAPFFHFSYDLFQAGAGLKGLSVLGHGKYAGYLLTDVDGSMHSSVSDGMTYRATSGAKTLAGILERDYDVPDFTRLLRRTRY